ncbi:Prophage integrase IntA [compost metagenome]
MDTYPEHNGPVIKRALLLNAYLPARPGELIAMRWADIDLKRAEWRYTQSKVDEPHVMHLPRQVVALLREWKLQAGKGEWVFPSPKVEGKHIAKCTLPWARASADMYGARGVVSGHGWRAAFRTVARETLKCEPAILELAIGHGVDKASTSGLGRAYSREQMMDDRRQALQRWADWLDSLRG